MSYRDFIQKTRSEKVIFAHLDMVRLAKIFISEDNDTYSRVTDFTVVGVRVDNVELEKSESENIFSGEFYYDYVTSKLSLKLIDNSDPKTKSVIIKYRIFLSNAPYNISHDFSDGEKVEYLPLMKSIGSLKVSLDEDQTGTALESKSNLTLENSDGFWDNIYDTYIFENQEVSFYSWSPSIPVNQARRIFQGFVKDKSFSESDVKFNLVDEIFKLRRPLNISQFSEDDGTLTDSDIGSFKRRIYGRNDNVKCVGIDKTLDGFELSNPVSGSIGSDQITGTNFLEELSQNDSLIFEIDGEQVDVKIDSIEDDENLTLSDELSFTVNNLTPIVEPDIPYRRKNRNWHIADHRLNQKQMTVTEVISANRFKVDNAGTLIEGDVITIDGQARSIRRISFDLITTSQNFSPAPSVNDTVERFPLFGVFFGSKRLAFQRDFTITNTNKCILHIDELAEFNISRAVNNSFTLEFTNGSRNVTTPDTIDLQTALKPRDWIVSGSINHQVWYEVLQVNESDLDIRVAYAGDTTSTPSRRKNVKYIEDDSLITVSCFGKDNDGALIERPSDVVKDILINDAEITNLNNDSFDQAFEDCPYTMSLTFDRETKVRDAITLVNESCFGSVFQDIDFKINYNILNSDKEEELEALREDDILSYSVNSRSKIYNSIIASFRPRTDIFTGDESFSFYSFTSDFVNETSQIKEELEIKLNLYFKRQAETITQRYLLFNSMTRNVVSVKTKLNLALKTVNDKLYVSLDRLFKRYGTNSRAKIGIINSITKTGTDTSVEFNDLSGIFTRVPSVASNDADDYNDASEDQKSKFGYVLDNNTLTPDNTKEDDLGNFIIG